MADRDFDLRILKAGSHYLTDVRSPDGEEANHAFELPISPERLDELFRGLGHPRKVTRGGGSPAVRQARDFGRQLFETVFAGEIRDVFQRSRGRVEARGRDLRIRLRLGRDVPELLDLPWELLFDRGRNRFLALEPATTLVRHLPVQQRIEPMRVAPPLHILVAISNPGQAGYPALDVEQEWANLDRALRPLVNRGRLSLTRLDGVTQESLRQALKRDACHVLHYIGHGGYDSAAETGLLVLEDKDGGARSCGASRLTYLLREQPALRLVVLNSCEGGRSSRTDPFAGVAQSLVQGALPAVVAMQFPVTDAAAVVFASAFYEALAAGTPVDLALAAARREVNLRGEEGEIEWATPVLYMRGDGELFSYEEREPVQPEPTNVGPRTPTPPLETGAAPTAVHDREPKVEPAKTQPEEAGKKPPEEPPPSPWKIAGPIIAPSGAGVGATSAPGAGSQGTGALPPGHVIGGQWLPKGLPFKDKLTTGVKAILGFVGVIVGGYLLVMNSPQDWWFVQDEAHVPVRGLVLSSFVAVLWIAGEIQKRSGNILMIAFVATVILLWWGLSGNSYPMEELFSPRMERFPTLPYWTELPGGFGKIKFWHIWIATAALAALVAIAKKPAWGGFLLMIPVFFLWNQLLG